MKISGKIEWLLAAAPREFHPCSFKAALPIACDALNARTVAIRAFQIHLYVVAHKPLCLFCGVVFLARPFPYGEKRSWRTRRSARYRQYVFVCLLYCTAVVLRAFFVKVQRLCRPAKTHRQRYAFAERQIAHSGKRGKGNTLPHGLKKSSYMKGKGTGNKAHLQSIFHFLVHIRIGVACVVFQRAGTKPCYVTLFTMPENR